MLTPGITYWGDAAYFDAKSDIRKYFTWKLICLENSFILGFNAKFNSTFTIGAQVYGVMPTNYYQFNRSNYWDASNDTNTYIVGASVNNLKDINFVLE